MQVALDLGDVAALNVPVRVVVRRDLPLQVELDAGDAVNLADILKRATAQRPGRQVVPAEVDILVHAPSSWKATSSSSISRQSAINRTPSSNTLVPSSRKPRHLGVVDRSTEPAVGPGRGGMVAGHINRLDAGDVFDVGDIGGMHDREDLRQPGVHAGAVERRFTAQAGRLQNLGLPGTAAVVGVAVVPVTQSAVVTTLMPPRALARKAPCPGQTPWNVRQSGRAARMSSMRPVALTPIGPMPTMSPASRPILSGD